MENTRASSHKSYRVKSKFPVILTKKSNQSQITEKLIFKENPSSHSSTPEPSLVIQLKKIHRRQVNPSPIQKVDPFNDQTNEALSNLIKNNAITFMSPNEFINQIHNDSMNQSPSQRLRVYNSSTLTTNKISKSNENSDLSHFDNYSDFRVSTSSSIYRSDKTNIKMIEVTGYQIPKLIRKNYVKNHEIASSSVRSQDLHWSKLLNSRKSYKPVVVYNKQHKYFRPVKQDDITSSSYYHLSNN
jgi:hypothetical protein